MPTLNIFLGIEIERANRIQKVEVASLYYQNDARSLLKRRHLILKIKLAICLFSSVISLGKRLVATIVLLFSEYYVMTCKTHSSIVG